MGWLRRLLKAEEGSIALMGALALGSTLAIGGFAVEFGQGYAAKVRNQRVADMGALAAATAFKAAPTGTGMPEPLDVARAVFNGIVRANGIVVGSGTTAQVDQVTVNGATALKAVVITPVPIKIADAVSVHASFNVASTAIASIPTAATGGSGCITALGSTGNMVSATGGASITATGCAIVTNGVVASDNGSARISGSQITAQSITDPAKAWNQAAVTTNPTANNFALTQNGASDGIKNQAAVKTALCQVGKLTGAGADADYADGNTNCVDQLALPATHSVAGADITLGYRPLNSGQTWDNYQTTDHSCKYNIPAGNYVIGKLTVPGGCEITFADNSNLNFNTIDMSGQAMTVGNGQFVVAGNFGFNSGSTITIGNGYHSFGTLFVSGGRKLYVGAGDFNVTGRLALDGGGSEIRVALANGDTVKVGSDAAGNAINVAGGSVLSFDRFATGAATGIFSANGSVTSSGGSTIIFPKSVTHVIKGDLSLNGSSTFGAGIYLVKGNFTNNTGGTMTGTNVSFALGGTFTLSGGTSLDLAATSVAAPTYGITDVLVATKSAANTSIGGGSQNRYGGLLYAPNSNMSVSGGSSISSSGSACMMLVVRSVASSGSGAVNASKCASIDAAGGAAATGTVKLIR